MELSGRPEQKQDAVTIEALSVAYGSNTALTGVNLTVGEGDFLAVIGPNGGGKSTLLKTIVGLIPPVEGRVSIFGRSPVQARHLIGYVPQITEFDRRFPITVREVVLTGRLKGGLRPFHRYSREDHEAAANLLELTGIEPLRDRQVCGLSGGEFQKMLIARALATNPKLLLLDEPTAGVDIGFRGLIFDLLDQLSRNVTIIMVTHDLAVAAAHVQKLACLNGSLFYHGDAKIDQALIDHLFGCPVDILAHDPAFCGLKKHGEKVL